MCERVFAVKKKGVKIVNNSYLYIYVYVGVKTKKYMAVKYVSACWLNMCIGMW